MIWRQKTLGKSVTMKGTGLHTGVEAVMTLEPAPVNTGLVFVVPGPDGEVEIPARVEYAVARDQMNRATSLEKDGARVTTVEHILAALYGMGVTNCRIGLEGGEPPVTDCASGRKYVEMVDEAGVVDQGIPALSYHVKRWRRWREGDIQISVEPADGFLLSFHIDYDDPAIGIQDATFSIQPDVFREEIAPARTFALMKDVAALQEMGLAKGGNPGNALVFDNGKLAGDQVLRFPDECVRHKILDLLGDLALLGMPLQGHVHARCSGHDANVEFVRQLAQSERSLPRICPPRDPQGWDIGSIMEIMPHRYPFLLVDRIISLVPGESVTGLKNVTINESFFQGHFPGHPVMPAVLIIEAMAQTGGVLLLSSVDDARGKLVYFSGIDGARFRRPVTPGDQLRFELEMVKLRGPMCKMHGTAYVDSVKVAEADLMSTIVDT